MQYHHCAILGKYNMLSLDSLILYSDMRLIHKIIHRERERQRERQSEREKDKRERERESETDKIQTRDRQRAGTRTLWYNRGPLSRVKGPAQGGLQVTDIGD